MITHCDQEEFILGMQRQFDTCTSINMIHYNNRMDKYHMIISIDAEKAFNQIQHAVMINTQQTSYRRNIPQKK
jgi:hypothetical protein